VYKSYDIVPRFQVDFVDAELKNQVIGLQLAPEIELYSLIPSSLDIGTLH
jgi:hypothetical protein